ncbi:MAG: TRAP transporter large permease [Chloroflexi bacterium]|nr:TRAP transporter large permease [Chloroflexota bacterium]
MPPTLLLLVGFVAFLVLAFARMPIGFAFAIVGFVGVILLKGLGPALSLVGMAPFQWGSQSSLIVVALFIAMGQFAYHSGISRDLYAAAHKWIGGLPGGLALATNLASTTFAGCTGSSIASAATMGSLAYPEMKRHNYDDRLATGSICAGGTLGILIPPSVVMVIYGFLTATPIGPLLIAGILPGVLLSGLFMLVILISCLRNPELGPRGEAFSWKERVFALKGVWAMSALFGLVIGGIYLGIFSPSEAGAIGAFGAIVIALIKRQLTLGRFVTALKESLQITCMALTILIGAMIFSVFVTVSGVPDAASAWLTALQIPPLAVLLLILFMYIPLGMVLDAMSMVFLTIPTVFPIVKALGYDPIWFGVLVVLVVEMALLTPPVGMVSYVVQGVTRVPMQNVFRGGTPFVGAMLLGLAILIAFPDIVLFLPNTMK